MKTTLRLLTLAFTLATALPAVAAEEFYVQDSWRFPTNLLPPPTGRFLALAGDVTGDGMINFPDAGVVVSNFQLTRPTSSMPPPGPGETQDQDFGITVTMGFSMGAGSLAQRITAQGQVTLRTLVGSDFRPDARVYDTEMLEFNLSGGGLPAGMMIRESPTLASTGKTVQVLLGNGDGSFQTSSFFDIFTEISVDGGATWSPSGGPCRMILTASSGEITAPTPNLPPLNGHFTGALAVFGQGVTFRNLTLGHPSESFAPPDAGASQTHTITAVYDGGLSFDGGNTVSKFSAPATLTQKVTHYLESETTRFFDTEMLQLDVAGGSLPPSVMLRASPTKASVGRTSVHSFNGTFRIASSFDVFLEVSVDGGMNWLPTSDGPCLFALPDTTPRALVSVDDPVPGAGKAGSGIPAGALFTDVGMPAIGANGDVAFLAKWRVTGPKNPIGVGLFLRSFNVGLSDHLELLAKVGDTVGGSPLGGGMVLKSINDGPQVSDAGTVLFTGTATPPSGGGAPSIIAVLVGLIIPSKIVAQTGQAAPEVPNAILHTITTVAGVQLQRGASLGADLGDFGIIMIGTMQPGRGGITGKNNRALWATGSAGVLRLLVQEGMTTNTVNGEGGDDILTVKSFHVLEPIPGANGMQRAFNGNGEVVLEVTYTDRAKTTGILHINVP